MFMDALTRRVDTLPVRVRARLRTEGDTHARLRGVIDDVCEERLKEELTRSQSFDDAHGRATARPRPCARGRGVDRRCGDRWWRRDGQDRAARREIVGAAPRREQADVGDADEAFRQDVQQEAPEEFVDIERQRAHLAPVPIVLPPKRDGVVRDGDEPVIGDGDAMRVPREVVQHVGGAAKGRLRVDHPRLVMERSEPRAKSGLRGQSL